MARTTLVVGLPDIVHHLVDNDAHWFVDVHTAPLVDCHPLAHQVPKEERRTTPELPPLHHTHHARHNRRLHATDRLHIRRQRTQTPVQGVLARRGRSLCQQSQLLVDISTFGFHAVLTQCRPLRLVRRPQKQG